MPDTFSFPTQPTISLYAVRSGEESCGPQPRTPDGDPTREANPPDRSRRHRRARRLLTQFHSDYIDGLGELLLQRWAGGGRSEPAPLYGPTGVEAVARGFDVAYGQDFGYCVAHHGEAVAPRSGAGARARPFALPPDGTGEVVLERDGVKVMAFRFDYAGRSAVLRGDTAKSANLEAFARGADLLVHEALAPHLVEVITAAAERAGNERIAKISRDGGDRRCMLQG